MKYKIGRKVFGSKDKVKNYFSYILKNTRDGEELTGDYLEDVIGLLQYHTERDEKIGCGIKAIKVERHIDTTRNQKSFTSHFQIYRLDGSDIDFSYKNCIRNLGNNYKDKREREKRLKAFRFVVRPQIDAFRDNAFGNKKYLKCEVLGVNFSKATCHIDHKEPKTFGQILEDFLSKYKLNFNSIEILNVDDIYNTIKCEKIRENWFNFHKETAVLRAIHKTANLSSSKRKYNF